jgi:hypothetical protein
MVAAALAVEEALAESQLRQVKNMMYKSQRQVEEATVLSEYKDL